MSVIRRGSEKLLHLMSVTKAAVGLMYHVHEKNYPRDTFLKHDDKYVFTIGQCLNMMTGKKDDQWNFDSFRTMVESGEKLHDYSLEMLLKATPTTEWEYNNLAYQLLASNMRDIAFKFGKFMNDPVRGGLQKEMNWNGQFIFFYGGKDWRWEHTKTGEPLGPHGLEMTPSFAKRFGELAKDHVMKMSKSQRISIGKKGWTNYKSPSKLHKYWNGWWFSNKCAYAIGHVCQIIAITPSGVQTQVYEEDWDNPLNDENNLNDERWFFVDRIENKLQSSSSFYSPFPSNFIFKL